MKNSSLESLEIFEREIFSNVKGQTLFLVGKAQFPDLFDPVRKRLFHLKNLINCYVLNFDSSDFSSSTPCIIMTSPHINSSLSSQPLSRRYDKSFLTETKSKIDLVCRHWLQLENALQKLLSGPYYSLSIFSSSSSSFSSSSCVILDFFIDFCVSPDFIQQKGFQSAILQTAFSLCSFSSFSCFLFHILVRSILYFNRIISLPISSSCYISAVDQHQRRIYCVHAFLFYILPSFLAKWALYSPNPKEAVEIVKACFSSLSNLSEIHDVLISPPSIPLLFSSPLSPQFGGVPLASLNEKKCIIILENAFEIYLRPYCPPPPSITNSYYISHLIFSLASLTHANATVIINELFRCLSDTSSLSDHIFVPLFSMNQPQSQSSFLLDKRKEGMQGEKSSKMTDSMDSGFDGTESLVIFERFFSLLQLEGRLLEFISIIFTIFDVVGRTSGSFSFCFLAEFFHFFYPPVYISCRTVDSIFSYKFTYDLSV